MESSEVNDKVRAKVKWASKAEITWLRRSKSGWGIFYAVSVLSVGLFPLFCFLVPHWNWMERMTTKPCEPEEAAFISRRGEDDAIIVLPVFRISISDEEARNRLELMYFVDGVSRYVCSRENHFSCIPLSSTPAEFLSYLSFPRSADSVVHYISRQHRLRAVYGPNTLELPDVGVFEILLRTVFSPFYLFQYFSVTVWMIEDYIMFSVLILVVTVGGIYMTTAETHHNLKRLKALAGGGSDIRLLVADEQYGHDKLVLRLRSDSVLVSGDIFALTPNMVLPCDAVLLSGRVVIDESMLTGESIPVSKQSIKLDEMSEEQQELASLDVASINEADGKITRLQKECSVDFATRFPACVLYAGTKVQSTYADVHQLSSVSSDSANDDFINSSLDAPSAVGSLCYAVAYRTGFNSAKGCLIASLLDPKDGFVSFFNDSIYVILYMFLLATALYGVAAIRLYGIGLTDGFTLFFMYLDAITIAVPPSLVACLTIATTIAMNRLNDEDIFVSDTNRISWAGLINSVAFDKTGTLTEEKVQFEKVMYTQFGGSSNSRHETIAGLTIPSGSGASISGGTDADDACSHFDTYMSYLQSGKSISTPRKSKHTRGRLENKIQFVSSSGYHGGPNQHSHTMMDTSSWEDDVPLECVELLATCHSLSLQPYDDYTLPAVNQGSAAAPTYAVAEPIKGTKSNDSLTNSWNPSNNGCDVENTRSMFADDELRHYFLSRQHIVGDLLEVELFMATKWTLAMQDNYYVCAPPPPIACSNVISTDNSKRTILRHFPFSPTLMRSASLMLRGEIPTPLHSQYLHSIGNVKAAGSAPLSSPKEKVIYYVKGSVETLASICSQQSVPVTLTHTLTSLAKQGLRVLGMAYRYCNEPLDDLLHWKQSNFESKGDLVFLGLCVLSSALKPTSTEVVGALRQADVFVQMITGDHMHTALAVARECGIVDDDGILSTTSDADGCNASDDCEGARSGGGDTDDIEYASFSSLTRSLASISQPNTSRRLNSCPRLLIIDADVQAVETTIDDAGNMPLNQVVSEMHVTDSVSGQVVHASLDDILDAAAITSYGWDQLKEDIDEISVLRTTVQSSGFDGLGRTQTSRRRIDRQRVPIPFDTSGMISVEEEEKPLLASGNRFDSYTSSVIATEKSGLQGALQNPLTAQGEYSDLVAGGYISHTTNLLGPVELAVTGKALHMLTHKLSPTVLRAIIRYSKVFARMKPADKKQIVLLLQGQLLSDRRISRIVGSYGNNSSNVPVPGAVDDMTDDRIFHVLFCGGLCASLIISCSHVSLLMI
jgi:magnesium-transporting ATPase (P-type)